MPTRRQFLAATALATLAAGCGRRKQRGLTVFVYSGLDKIFETHFVAPFREKTGANVTLDAGWWDAIGKLKASPKGEPAYDLVLTDATQGYPAIKSGMFRQLDFDKIPNHKALAPAALDNWVAKERYGVTFHESAMTLGFDPKQVKDAPTGWGDLMREDLREKLSLYNSFYFSLYTFACMKAAADGKPGTAHQLVTDDINGVLAFAKRERERVRFWWPSGPKMLQDLTQGNFAAGNGHSVTFLQAVKEKPDLGFVTPEADRAFVQLMWVVPADTPNAALAEEAIDFLLSQGVQAAVARAGMGTSHAAAAKEVAAVDPVWAKTYPHTDEHFKTMRYFPYDAYFKDWDRITRAWEEDVLRKG
ncbi:MAG TPA: extracellular solute-binding protein [Gemmataceae bacterium]|nr:extracellular solute-binding protein [Gemmataceae bacterium]